MPDNDKAIELIALYDTTYNADFNFRNIYQEAADVMFPRENQITTERAPGETIGRNITDQTGTFASMDMAAGLSINLFPPGDLFYNVIMANKDLNKIDTVKRKLGQITEISHAKRANSNFMLQANESLRATAVFGTLNMFSEYKPGIGLTYKDYDVAMYTFMENPQSLVDVMMIEFEWTAKQIFQKWGDNSGETVLKHMADPKTMHTKSKIVWITRPRDLDKQIGSTSTGLPFETFFMSRIDSHMLEESGYHEFPFQVARWSHSSGEKWGRGVGTFATGPVTALQTERTALTDCAELHNNPPKEVLENHEGPVKVKPGDLNFVIEKGTIRSIEQQALGNFSITKDIIEMDREEVRKMFFNQAFNQLEQLKGDRRNELEIRSRLAEGLRKLVMPVTRLNTEWLTPLITRDIMLLQRAGEFGEMPPEMGGAEFKIEYVGTLALELQSAQSTGFVRWVAEGREMAEALPTILDNINGDNGFKRRGETLGVNMEDINSDEDIKAIRDAREQRRKEQQALEVAQVAGGAYPGSTKAPESGSPAEALMG